MTNSRPHLSDPGGCGRNSARTWDSRPGGTAARTARVPSHPL